MSKISDDYEEMLNGIKKSGKLTGFRDIMKAKEDFPDPRDRSESAKKTNANNADYTALADAEDKEKNGISRYQQIIGEGAAQAKRDLEETMDDAFDEPDDSVLVGKQRQVKDNMVDAEDTALADAGAMPKGHGFGRTPVTRDEMHDSKTLNNGAQKKADVNPLVQERVEDRHAPNNTEKKDVTIHSPIEQVTDEDRANASKKDDDLVPDSSLEDSGTEHTYDSLAETDEEKIPVKDRFGNHLSTYTRTVTKPGEIKAVDSKLKENKKTETETADTKTANSAKRNYNKDVKDYVAAFTEKIKNGAEKLTPEMQSQISKFEADISKYFQSHHNVDNEGNYQKPKDVNSVQGMSVALDDISARIDLLKKKGQLPASLDEYQSRIDNIRSNVSDQAAVNAYMPKYSSLLKDVEDAEKSLRNPTEIKRDDAADAETTRIKSLINELTPAVTTARTAAAEARKTKAANTRAENKKIADDLKKEQEDLAANLAAQAGEQGPEPDPEEQFREGRKFALPREGESLEYQQKGNPYDQVGILFNKLGRKGQAADRLVDDRKLTKEDIAIYQKLNDAFRRTHGKLAEVQQMATGGEFRAWANPALRNRPGYMGRLIWMIDQGYDPRTDTYHNPKNKADKFLEKDRYAALDDFTKNTLSYEDSDARVQARTAEGRMRNDPDALYESAMSILAADSQSDEKLRQAFTQLKAAANATNGSDSAQKASLELAKIFYTGNNVVKQDHAQAEMFVADALTGPNAQVREDAKEFRDSMGPHKISSDRILENYRNQHPTVQPSNHTETLTQQANLDRAKTALEGSTGRLDENGNEIKNPNTELATRYLSNAIKGGNLQVRQEALALAEKYGLDVSAAVSEAESISSFENDDYVPFQKPVAPLPEKKPKEPKPVIPDEETRARLRAEHDGVPYKPEGETEEDESVEWSFEGDGKEVPLKLRPYWNKSIPDLRKLCEEGDTDAQYVFCRRQTGRVPRTPKEFDWYLNAAKRGSIDALVAAALAAGSSYSHPSVKTLEAETNNGMPLGFRNRLVGGKQKIFEVLSLATELGGDIGEWARKRIMDLDVTLGKKGKPATRPDDPYDGKWYKMWADIHPGEIGALHPLLETRQLDELLNKINLEKADEGYDTSGITSDSLQNTQASQTSSMLDQGTQILSNGDFQGALKFFRDAVKNGNPDGYIGLARVYATTTGAEHNLNTAEGYAMKARDAGANAKLISDIMQTIQSQKSGESSDEANARPVNTADEFGNQSEMVKKRKAAIALYKHLTSSTAGPDKFLDYIDTNINSNPEECMRLANAAINAKDPRGFLAKATVFSKRLQIAKHNYDQTSEALLGNGYVKERNTKAAGETIEDVADYTHISGKKLATQRAKAEANIPKFAEEVYRNLLRYALSREDSSEGNMTNLLHNAEKLDQMHPDGKYTKRVKRDLDKYILDLETMKLVVKPNDVAENPIAASKDVNPMTSFRDIIQKAMDEKNENRGYPLTSEPIIKDEKGYPSLLHAHIDSTLPIADTYRVVSMGADKDFVDMKPRQADCKKR